MQILIGLLIPFLGTTLGAACVFFLKNQIGPNVQRMFTGFAAGVMVAASVWSLLIPAMDMSGEMGKLAFIPAVAGFLLGILFLLLLDSLVPHLHMGSNVPEGRKSGFGRTAMLLFAVTIHNFPEGAACGAIFAGVLSGEGSVTMAGALALSLGIALQNFPEGAIISLPLRSEGNSRAKSFLLGTLSGAVEPLGALLAIGLAGVVTPILPYMLSFAAGAMIYVVVEELIPEASTGSHSNIGTIAFAIGFSLMMVLDIALG
ncbi:MAG TPA: ZIP family metal transporter [Candidatus Acetatifactor stercoripullorum]|uniref:ZIP family metal transporter n=1 Tax=Candidatus Acetatifactor stercoripullorum TaxID=2838414 RepID=A0A9D1R6Q2_9FIRM|nr:ZIP family metal transporter [uncultured Acetatifactor sp.]HIW81875.1 ZIP family metal transporter [Candidatus Acetatifactor stercoripullorum]